MDLPQHLVVGRLVVERGDASDELIKQQSYLIQIALSGRVAGGGDLGRHDAVVDDAGSREALALQLLRDTKIGELDDGALAALHEQHVPCVKIAVDEIAVVQVLDGGEDLPRELDRELGKERPLQPVAQRAGADLERHVEEVIALEGVVHVDDVGVAQAQEPLGLARPLGLHLGVRAVGGDDELQGVALIERADRLVDRAVGAPPERARDEVLAVARAEHRAALGEPDARRRGRLGHVLRAGERVGDGDGPDRGAKRLRLRGRQQRRRLAERGLARGLQQRVDGDARGGVGRGGLGRWRGDGVHGRRGVGRSVVAPPELGGDDDRSGVVSGVGHVRAGRVARDGGWGSEKLVGPSEDERAPPIGPRARGGRLKFTGDEGGRPRICPSCRRGGVDERDRGADAWGSRVWRWWPAWELPPGVRTGRGVASGGSTEMEMTRNMNRWAGVDQAMVHANNGSPLTSKRRRAPRSADSR